MRMEKMISLFLVIIGGFYCAFTGKEFLHDGFMLAFFVLPEFLLELLIVIIICIL